MSMAPQALERSVLERKERDELAAIAEAMGVKPGSRASKATLIDQILREAGIETSAPERPKRGRSSRATATQNGQAGPAGKAEGGSGETTSGERPEGTVSEGPVAEAPDRAGADSDGRADTPATDAAPVSTNGEAGSATGAADASTQAQLALGDAPATSGTAPEADGGSSAGSDSDTSAEAGPAQEGSGSEPAGPAGSAGSGTTPTGEAGSNGAAAPADAADAAKADASTQAPATGDRGRTDGRHDGRDGRDDRQRDQRDQRGGRQQNFDGGGDVGNRRSRRRRGRDRGDRDLPQDRGQDAQQYSGELVPAEGLLDLRDEGYGFLRTTGYLAGSRDAYVSLSQVRRFALRKGDYVQGASRPAGSNEKYPALLRIDTVNGMTPDEARGRPRFEDLTPLFPDERLRLEVAGDPHNMIARIVDLVSPIGKGQRGLIVSPPKAGKTTVLKQIAHSIEANNPEVKLMVLLVDERPEEVTDFRRSVKGEVIASTFDRPSDEHAQVAELSLERAKRLVELGQDVVIVLDGITRLSRAYNLAGPATGRIMSGGLDVNALYPPKRFFGAARNIEEGGSLTILATALVETGGKMDEVIFEEFKGTGNMELKLDRKLAERRIYPALDVNASSTRHEELLFDRGQLPQVWKLRRVLNALEPGAGLELLMDKIKSTKSNDEFLAEIAKAPVPAI
jgi:transcription termination factor Rho